MTSLDIDQAKKDFLPPEGWKRNPILLQLKKLDEALTYKLALAFTEDSLLGHLQYKLRMFEYSAHTLMCFALALFFWYMSISMASKTLFTNIILAMLIDVLVIAFVKAACRRRRPGVTRQQYEVNPSSTNLSFPSGFVSRATMIFLIILSQDFIAFVPIAFLTWAVLMLLTKIALGRFFIFDAVAGVPIGYAVNWFIQAVWMDAADVAALEGFFAGQFNDE
ncbi:phospholipid phosphatase 6-like [Varroa destructor]|uniref:Phosphatidic acid phosphatase type 2/haloperoxidase domain-containing protein n=1 Tax=Varroa destructor TaxID=109461 RepID=A0A7M7J0R4_VARDE|nr:phospholipid phosphatase 6-like [Varroa destructor]XP_022644445.1 phospholipid phosphatase 6-like [Varroa destructor]XP_022644446.1 phospholipid phosphatase 6-like [Varroa destructor]XP_022644447.1 phospholipid phosphatase 6-like [Varroa destructor]XP_022644448.1 phospholipid phosphatase 6-like [Varroa destructor]XP_022644449.1 phospholipid phosphatase 6-like [Varroa destructor]XP_022644450.1 phospholipid phosphatase 6-like [Varroa destructor]XP_022644451.1 phospholipid phosphatase 6-like